MKQYLVSNGNGVPGIEQIRYSVTKGSMGKKVLNLVIMRGKQFTAQTVDLEKLNDDPNSNAYILNFNPFAVGLDNEGYISDYNPKSNNRNEGRAQVRPLDLDYVSIRDSYVIVTDWFFGIDDDKDQDFLTVNVILGEGMLEGKELPSTDVVPSAKTNVFQMDPTGLTKEERDEARDYAVKNGLVLKWAA